MTKVSTENELIDADMPYRYAETPDEYEDMLQLARVRLHMAYGIINDRSRPCCKG